MTINGCNNAERKDIYHVHVREYRPDGTYAFKLQEIKDTSSRECKYDFRVFDMKCSGCVK